MLKLAPLVVVALASLPAIAVAQAPAESDLVLTADHEGTTFYVEQGVRRAGWDSQAPTAGSSTTFLRLCTAPCEAFVPPGDYLFTLSRYRTGTQDADYLTLAPGRHVLRAHYESRQAIRVVSAVLQVALVVGAIVLLGAAVSGGGFGWSGDDAALLVGGLVVGAAALFPLTVLRDEVSVRVVS